jgi:hypothetical protein
MIDNEMGKGQGRRLVVSSQPRLYTVRSGKKLQLWVVVGEQGERNLKPGEEEEAACRGCGRGRKRKKEKRCRSGKQEKEEREVNLEDG